MTTTATNIQEVLDLMASRVAAAKEELSSNIPVANVFYLVAGRNDMVVVEAEGIFRLDACSPDKGYAFRTFSRAKTAANKWNGALNAQQKAAHCTVHAVSRAQYLEYIVDNLTELRPNMEALRQRLLEQEVKH